MDREEKNAYIMGIYARLAESYGDQISVQASFCLEEVNGITQVVPHNFFSAMLFHGVVVPMDATEYHDERGRFYFNVLDELVFEPTVPVEHVHMEATVGP